MKHLQEKSMTYFEHLRNALKFARYSARISAIAFVGTIRYTIHAFVPTMFGNATAEWMTEKQVQARQRF